MAIFAMNEKETDPLQQILEISMENSELILDISMESGDGDSVLKKIKDKVMAILKKLKNLIKKTISKITGKKQKVVKETKSETEKQQPEKKNTIKYCVINEGVGPTGYMFPASIFDRLMDCIDDLEAGEDIDGDLKSIDRMMKRFDLDVKEFETDDIEVFKKYDKIFLRILNDIRKNDNQIDSINNKIYSFDSSDKETVDKFNLIVSLVSRNVAINLNILKKISEVAILHSTHREQ